MANLFEVLNAVKCGHLSGGVDSEGYKTLTWDGLQVSEDRALELAKAWNDKIVSELRIMAAGFAALVEADFVGRH